MRGVLAAALVGACAGLAGLAGAEPATGGGPVLTLEEALAIALRDNLPLVNAELEVEKSTEGVEAIATRRLPELEVGVAERYHVTDESYTFEAGDLGTVPFPIPTTTVDVPTTPDFTTLVTASARLPLAQQYRIGLAIRQEELNRELADEQLRAHRQSVADDVKSAYYAISQTQGSLAAEAEMVEFLRELDVLVENRVAQQAALAYEAMEVEARLARSEARDQTLHNELASHKENLNRLMARDVATPFQVTETPPEPPFAVDMAQAQAEALAQRPEVREARIRVEHADTSYKIKQSEYFPDLDLVVSYTSPFGSELLPEDVTRVGLHARWEFYDWGRKSHQLAQHRASILQAKNDVRNTEAQVVLDVNVHIRRLQEARDAVEVARLSRQASREKLRVKLNQYRQQTVLLQDVLQTQADLAEADRELHNARLEVWKTTASLERAVGAEVGEE